MASVTASVRGCVIERGNDDAPGAAVTNYAISTLKRATVYIDSNGVDVAGGTDTLDCNLATAIQNSVRNGKTVTVRTLCVSQALINDNAGAQVGYAGYHTVSSNTVSITPKSTSYLTGGTNATITGAHVVVQPYGVYVAYTEA